MFGKRECTGEKGERERDVSRNIYPRQAELMKICGSEKQDIAIYFRYERVMWGKFSSPRQILISQMETDPQFKHDMRKIEELGLQSKLSVEQHILENHALRMISWSTSDAPST